MPIRRIGYACPLCDRNGITSHLYEAPPALATRCETNGEHTWTDTTELRMMQPRMLALPKPALQPVNRVPLTVDIPEQLMANLQARNPAGLNDRVIEALQYLAQPQCLFLGADDLERIQEKVERPLTSGSDLYGALFEMGEKVSELKLQIKQMLRTQTVRNSGTGVMLDLGEMLPKAVQKAEENNMTVDEYLGTYLQEALLNDWVMV